ncbi:hypothetical protein Tsubulata_024316 [Turnera subulata]|uniref:Serine/threonine-protein kinase RIO2 n=1 Tax=Turnera subulata TaxID=218843 RepID=A0A9Q0F6X2_9ROSI|nr:hypothetical protein Tsubulata_024316 [Turnera subulata]
MKLDVDVLRYLSKDDFRVLTAVEMGMRNHEIVPWELIHRIASLKHGGTYKVLKNLLKHKLIHHDSSKYDGYRLTYLGYDFLAIKALVNRGVFASVGRRIGAGKESDIFEVATEDGTILAMKLHRLGRISFRAVKSKRDYLRHRQSFNWLYLSRLAALKEFAFMKALGEHGFPVPKAVDCNRHCVVMSLVQGHPLVQVKEMPNPETVFETIVGLVVRLAEHGLIHCDFNEFNIMIDDDEKVTIIDFPQMSHELCNEILHSYLLFNAFPSCRYFERDVECIFKFFQKRFNLSFEEHPTDDDDSPVETDQAGWPSFSSISKTAGFLDKELAASGFTRKEQDDIDKFIEGGNNDAGSDRESEDAGSDGESADPVSEPESIEDEEHISAPTISLDPLQLQEKDKAEKSQSTHHGAGQSNESEVHDASDKEEEDQTVNENEAELKKGLSKQRRRAMAAARRTGSRLGSRNSNKGSSKKQSCIF